MGGVGQSRTWSLCNIPYLSVSLCKCMPSSNAGLHGSIAKNCTLKSHPKRPSHNQTFQKVQFQYSQLPHRKKVRKRMAICWNLFNKWHGKNWNPMADCGQGMFCRNPISLYPQHPDEVIILLYAVDIIHSIASLQMPVIVASGPYTYGKKWTALNIWHKKTNHPDTIFFVVLEVKMEISYSSIHEGNTLKRMR